MNEIIIIGQGILMLIGVGTIVWLIIKMFMLFFGNKLKFSEKGIQ